MPGGWPPAGRPRPPKRKLALKFLASKPERSRRVKEFALAVFNLNAFFYVN